MKIILTFFLVICCSFAVEAKCQPTNARAKLEFGNSVTLYILVMKNTDCIFASNRFNIEKAEITSHPRNGKSGINIESKKFIYLPKDGFVGEDSVTVKVYYRNDKGELGSSLATIVYTVM